jgi:hypothetical protein
LKKSVVERAANFLCMRSSSLESVIVTEFQATEAYSSLDMTKTTITTNTITTTSTTTNNSIFYYLYAESTATRPITYTSQ